MFVYIVYNRGLRYDSDYEDIIGVFDSLEKAKACIKTSADDFIKACDRGADEGFDNYSIRETEDGIIIRENDNQYFNGFEEWYYDAHKVE